MVDLRSERNILWMQSKLLHVCAAQRLILVGCGGLGLSFAVYAAHIGFRRFVLCDPDNLDESNLNRHFISTMADIGAPKVSVLKAYLEQCALASEIKTVKEPFPNEHIVRYLQETGLVVSCVDDVKTRLALEIICRKSGVTLVDLGVGFLENSKPSDDEPLRDGGGQVLVSRPRHACLLCLGFGRTNLTNDYYRTDGTAEPSSILLNGAVASIGLEVLLSEMMGTASDENLIRYDRTRLAISKSLVRRRPNCPICGVGAEPHVASVGEMKSLFSAVRGAA